MDEAPVGPDLDRLLRLELLEAIELVEPAPPGVVRPVSAGPMSGQVRVRGVDPSVADRPAGAREPADLELDCPVQERVAIRLGLVERSVPGRDRDSAVVVARRPGFDEPARAVAGERHRELAIAEQLEDADRPESRLPEIADGQQPKPA